MNTQTPVGARGEISGQLSQVRLYEHTNTARRQTCGQRAKPEVDLQGQLRQTAETL